MMQPIPLTRDELRGFVGRQIDVTAVYEETLRHIERGVVAFSILLHDVRLAATGKPLTDHIWLPFASSWQKHGLTRGDYFQFAAVVNAYRKGYQGPVDRAGRKTQQQLDFGLQAVSAPRRLARGLRAS